MGRLLWRESDPVTADRNTHPLVPTCRPSLMFYEPAQHSMLRSSIFHLGRLPVLVFVVTGPCHELQACGPHTRRPCSLAFPFP